jgi:hypothetical protein
MESSRFLFWQSNFLHSHHVDKTVAMHRPSGPVYCQVPRSVLSFSGPLRQVGLAEMKFEFMVHPEL